ERPAGPGVRHPEGLRLGARVQRARPRRYRAPGPSTVDEGAHRVVRWAPLRAIGHRFLAGALFAAAGAVLPVAGLRAAGTAEARDGNPVALGDRVLDLLQDGVERLRSRLLVAETAGQRVDELGLVHVVPSQSHCQDSRESFTAQRKSYVVRIQTCAGKEIVVS